MKYRAEIDGLRALAVVPVILFHAGFKWFSGGFVGVDVFFVVSGYLITTILIEDIENSRFSIANFYERRARRILPALFFVMLACIPFAWLWMLPSQIKSFFQSLVAVSLFASNFLFWSESGYFASAAEEKPLLHTWSLAVEEQYYVLFPIFLFLAWRFGKNRVFWTIVVLAACSFVLSELGWRNQPSANFYLAPTRAWELFSGSIATFVVQKRGVQTNNILSLLGLAAILFAFFVYDENTPFPSIYSIVPVVGVVLLVLFAGKETLAARLLGTRAFVGTGLISYSAYLWHQPLFAFAKIKLVDEPSTTLMGVLSLLSILLAIVSWKYVEQPFRTSTRSIFGRRAVFSISFLTMTVMVAIGCSGNNLWGNVKRHEKVLEGDVNHFDYLEYIDTRYIDCEPKSIASTALTWKGFLRCKQTKTGKSDWVLLGDSHAEHLFLGLAENNPDKNIVYYIFGGKPYVDNPQFSNVFAELENTHSPKRVFLTMHFVSRIVEHSELLSGFTKTVQTLQKFGHDVVLLGDIPKYDIHPEDCLFATSIEQSIERCSIQKVSFNAQKAVFEPALMRIATEQGIKYIPLDAPLCNEMKCSMISGNTILYRDNNHLNIPGSRLVGKYLNDILDR